MPAARPRTFSRARRRSGCSRRTATRRAASAAAAALACAPQNTFAAHASSWCATTAAARACTACYHANKDRAKIELRLRPAPETIMSGTLWKQGHTIRSWKKRRWLLDSNGLLSYFKDKDVKAKGTINLLSAESWLPQSA